jgi:hypothetical protein
MKKGMPPMMLVVGTADGNYRRGKEFVDKGRKLGAQFEGVYAEGQPHSFLGREGWFDKIMARIDDFLVRTGFLDPMPADAPVMATKNNKGGKKGAGKKGGGKK